MQRSILSSLTLITVLSGAVGCETTDRMLTGAERAVTSKTGQKRLGQYARDPEALLKDIRMAQKDLEMLLDALGVKVGEKWGKKEVKLPEQKKYVKYTQNYRSRAIVNFDTGEILVETLDDHAPQNSLRNAIVTTLLTPDDPRGVDLFSDKDITLTGDKEPYLAGLVLDQQGKSIRTPAEAEPFASYLVEKKSSTREIDQYGAKKTALVVTIRMVSNFSVKQAEKYRPVVQQFANQYQISPGLIFAIIRTESNFNPYAVSSAPAYGLMQLVPSTGGREAYKRAKGKDVTPSRDYLFNPTNNIDLGTAYLSVLTFDQLEEIANTVSREYCVISAYNTGPHNVFRAFSKDTTAAVNQINSLQPSAVYEHLRQHLPYPETRHYLEKVTASRKEFVNSSETVVR